jgi:hypothetical protein
MEKKIKKEKEEKSNKKFKEINIKINKRENKEFYIEKEREKEVNENK